MEEDIKILEEMKEKTKNAYDCSLLSESEKQAWKREVQAIENILTEREADKKRIKELEEEKEIYKKQLNSAFDRGFIHKDEIIDKIKELKKRYEEALEENSTKAFMLKCQIAILEEILEGKQ